MGYDKGDKIPMASHNNDLKRFFVIDTSQEKFTDLSFFPDMDFGVIRF